ncbi:MAG: serine hydrolase [Acidobacteriota bacterium]
MVKHGRFPRAVRLCRSVAMAALVALVAPGAATSAAAAAPQQRATKTPARAQAKPAHSADAARARRARLARQRAAAAQRALQDAQTPRFRIDDLGREVPDVRAAAAIVYNPETEEVLWESNAQAPRSIASITKVMTAIVTLDSGIPLDSVVTIQRSDVLRASVTYLATGYKVTVEDLLNLTLVASDNAAARALARVSPYGARGFVDRMNEKAVELGLTNTHYADPSGLLAANESSAYDQARLIAYASGDERISAMMRKAQHSVRLGRRIVTVNSTNQIVKTGDIDVLGGKTGFISRSGYCLATLLRLPETGQQVAVVVLGAQSNVGRFWETRHLFNWVASKARAVFSASNLDQPDEN